MLLVSELAAGTTDTTAVKHFMSLDAMDRLIGRQEHTGGMIALVPSAGDASRLSIPGWEPSSVLHTTLIFLGPDWPVEQQEQVVEIGRAIAEQVGAPVEANAWAAAHFNPLGPEPCAVYLVGGEGVALAKGVTDIAMDGRPGVPQQHAPWVPHITIGYGLTPDALTQFGPVVFDRVRVAFGEHSTVDFKL